VKSVLALVVAVAMVAGALYFRGYFDDGEGPGEIFQPDDPLHLICAYEFASVCRNLAGDDVTVEVAEAGQTAAELSGPERPQADAWLTLQPWPQIVAEARTRESLDPFTPKPTVLGRSPLVMAAWDDRAAVMGRRCGGTVTWRCVGHNAGNAWAAVGGERAWGPVEPGFGDPNVNATGLLVLGQATTDFLGTTAFSKAHLEQPAFQTWLNELGHGVPTFGAAENTPLQQMLLRGRSSFDFVGTTEAEAGPALVKAASGRSAGLSLLYPKPMVVAEAVVAPLNINAEDRVVELFEEQGAIALAEGGWRVEGQDHAPGVPSTPPLPAESNIPKAGSLEALRIGWGEIAR
jgi:hypothetical protein